MSPGERIRQLERSHDELRGAIIAAGVHIRNLGQSPANARILEVLRNVLREARAVRECRTEDTPPATHETENKLSETIEVPGNVRIPETVEVPDSVRIPETVQMPDTFQHQCPNCGEQNVFAGWTEFVPYRCPHCGLIAK